MVIGDSVLIGSGVTNALLTSDASGRCYAAALAIGAYERAPYVTMDALII